MKLNSNQQQQQQHQSVQGNRPNSSSLYQAQTISRATNLNQHHNQYANPHSVIKPAQYSYHFEQQASNNNKTISGYNTLNPQRLYQQQDFIMSTFERQAMSLNRPLCRCRVMYMGSSVPHITKNGLHGIQEPLRHLYPEEQFIANASVPSPADKSKSTSNTIDISHLSSSLGIDSWLSVWSNGLLLENVDEFGREIKRFFSIESLHYCAAVRYFDTATLQQQQQQMQDPHQRGIDLMDQNNNSQQQDQNSNRKKTIRFLPLDAPLFQCPGMIDAKHPPIFASIMRRTTGIKVLECHAFICRRDAASNALVRCCTQAYADLLNAKRLSVELNRNSINHRYERHLSGYERRAQSLSVVHRGASNRADNNCYQTVSDHRRQHPKESSSGGESNNEHLLDSSLEEPMSESDQNYAIITRANQSPRKQSINSAGSSLAQDGRPSQRTNYKVNGSSKSLYDNFTPAPTQQQQPSCCNQTEAQKLSHSLDLLDIGDMACCSLDGEDDISYSVVAKRHSKSMQNLDGPFEFTANLIESADQSSATRAARSSRKDQHQRSRHYKSAATAATNGSERSYSIKQRKAQSYQDMRVSSSRRQSLSKSSVHSGEHKVRPPVEPEHYEQVEFDKVSSSSAKAKRAKSIDRKHHDQTRKSSSSSKRRESAVFAQTNGNCCPMQYHQPAPLATPMYQPMPAMIPGPHHPALQAYHSPYMSPYLPAPHPHQPHHLYSPYHPPTIYDSPYLHQAHHSGLHYGYSPAISAYHQQQQLLAMSQQDRRKPSKTGVKSSIATRFRCLSPPLNFLSNSSHGHSSKESAGANENHPQTATSGSPAGPGEIISGQPGFKAAGQQTLQRQKKIGWIKRLSLTMTGNSNYQPGYESDNSQADNLNKTNRLSIDPIGHQPGTTAAAASATNGGQNYDGGEIKSKKRRSGLFSGSLTLGRQSKQHHPRLVTT